MSSRFAQLGNMASSDSAAFQAVPREECLSAARTYAKEQREAIRERHNAGESGLDVLRMLSETADNLLRGVIDFGLSSAANRDALLSRVCFCALGGYGRSQLSPFSDIDVCLLYEGKLDRDIEALNDYMIPFLWDVGFRVGHSIRSVSDAVELAEADLKALTSFLEARIIIGSGTAFSRLKLLVRELLASEVAATYFEARVRDRFELLSDEHKDLYSPEPDVKESKGGLRDFHTALWLLMMTYGPLTMDDVAGFGIITPDEHLGFVQGLDFVCRIRNELHFHANRAEDRLTYENQRHVTKALGYGTGGHIDIYRFMQDYYAAACQLHRFLRIAAQVCHQPTADDELDAPRATRSSITIGAGELEAGRDDANWFAEHPSRLMEVFWECARNRASLGRNTERRIAENLHLVTDAFRSSDVVHRFFVAICNRPLQAGFALRQAANAGLLGRYVPEFGAVQGVIRYEDFHHFPVDEHTLRAIEALDQLSDMSGPVAGCLEKALEHLPDPYILVMAILFHDIGKAEGEIHVEAGVEIAKRACSRMGVSDEDTERIAFLVQHHLTMTHLSQYRDIDDLATVEVFAKTMKTEERLRALFLLSYADMAAVGPGVWNDWKGALLMKLYLKAERILLGRAEVIGEIFWKSPKADEIRAIVRKDLRPWVDEHLRGLGERYFLAFSPAHIATHLECLARAREEGLAVDCTTHEETGMSEITVCTRDRHGLFADMAGGFASQLIDVNNAALFTRPDGYVIDCFTVADASGHRPLTKRQFGAFERVLRAVLLNGADIQSYVDGSRRRLFALLQPRIPVRTKIAFDNDSSRTHTVIDIETGDRTGLLYDIVQSMADAGLDIATSRIITDARRVRDSFYVTMDKTRIEDEDTQAEIRVRLHNAIHPRTLA